MPGSWPRCLEQNARSASTLHFPGVSCVSREVCLCVSERFLVLTSSASTRLVFLGVCKAVAFPLFILRRTLVQRSGTSLTSHSTALGLLQPSQQLARLEHCAAGARPAVGLCSIAFDPCELSQKWESFFLGNGHHL